MTTGWILRALIVSGCISIAALCVERLLARTSRSSARNQRWVWVVAMFVSVTISLASLWGKWTPPILSAIVRPERELQFSFSASREKEVSSSPAKTVLNVEGLGALTLTSWWRYVQRPMTQSYVLPAKAVALTCLALSVMGLSLFVVIHLWIRRRRAEWADGVVDGVKVRVASSVGPAVVGLRHPEIVVPLWVLGAPPETQRAIVRHERSHIVAGDSRTLAICGVLLAAMPWNVALWWQYRRLRTTIETDCDARVLAGGIDVRQYGAMLLNVATRSITIPVLSPAFCANSSLIERRIRAMTKRSFRFVHLQLVGLACLALVMVGMSADLAAPKAPQFKYRFVAMGATPVSISGTLRLKHGPRSAPITPLFSANGWTEQREAGNAEHANPFSPRRRASEERITITLSSQKRRPAAPNVLPAVTVASLTTR